MGHDSLCSRMVLFVTLNTMIAAEINLTPLEFHPLGFIDGLSRDRAFFIDGYGVPFFLGHLCNKFFWILIELIKTSFAANVDELALILGSKLFTHWSAADRTHFVGNVFLLICRDAGSNRARYKDSQEDGKNGFSHDVISAP